MSAATETMEEEMDTTEAQPTIVLKTASKRKRKKQPAVMYTNEILKKALDAIKTGVPVSTAAKLYNIPRTTLLYKNRGTLAPIIKNRGPECIVGEENERRLVQWIFDMSESGFPVSRSQLLDSVQLLLNLTKKKTVFTDNRPGRHWYDAFRTRNKELNERMSQNLAHGRASVTEQKVRAWFDEMREYFESKSLLDIDPSRVFNCDESALFLSPKEGAVMVKKGEKTAYNFLNNDEKECLTILLCGSAGGQVAPPMVIFPYKRIPGHIASNMPRKWGIGHSETGWTTGEAFYKYITNVFYPWLVENSVVFPVVLFLDAHTSYLTMALSDFCREKGVELVALYPNATNILQPLDVEFYDPLKEAWTNAVRQWTIENDAERLRRECFAKLLQRALESLDAKTILRDGFEKTGLHPFSEYSADYQKYFKNSEPSEATPIPQTTPSNVGRHEEYLAYIENEIEKSVLEMFNEVEEGAEWNGETIHESLFYLWRKIKSRVNSSQVSHSIFGDSILSSAI